MPRPSLFDTLRRRLHAGADAEQAGLQTAAGADVDPLLEAGRLLRQSREAAGLSLRQLALDTRISTPVLEALERGWRDRLPEVAYLRTMVPLLEKRLQLRDGSLQAALPSNEEGDPDHPGRRHRIRRFTPGSIDVFTSWQGTVLYGALTLGLIYGINLQQERLAQANLLTRTPLAPAPLPSLDPAANQARATGQVDGSGLLLQSYPDLRPLTGPGPALKLESLDQEDARLNFGRLQLTLKQPSRVTINASDGRRVSELQGARGTVELPLLPPLTVTIEPPPQGDGVRWNDVAVKADSEEPGQFLVGPRP